jgi:hypothetical protein
VRTAKSLGEEEEASRLELLTEEAT